MLNTFYVMFFFANIVEQMNIIVNGVLSIHCQP